MLTPAVLTSELVNGPSSVKDLSAGSESYQPLMRAPSRSFVLDGLKRFDFAAEFAEAVDDRRAVFDRRRHDDHFGLGVRRSTVRWFEGGRVLTIRETL